MKNNSSQSSDSKEILGLLATILDGITVEQRKNVLTGLFSDNEIQSLDDDLSIFRAIRSIYEDQKTLDFILPIANRIQLTNSFRKDVSEEISHLKYLASQLSIKTRSENSKKQVFVMMPFEKEFFLTYERAIMPGLEEIGCLVKKADDLHTINHIVEDIYKQIVDSAFLVADTTGRNPNVFYEIGYAHGKNKSVILLAQKAEDIPFDLRSLRHIIYDSNKPNTLKEELQLVAKVILRST